MPEIECDITYRHDPHVWEVRLKRASHEAFCIGAGETK